MKIAVFATGSRGDVQPYIALGVGLTRAGHAVRLVTHENFAGLVEAHGLAFWPVPGDVTAVAQSEAMQERLEKGNFLSIMSQMAKEAEKEAIGLAEAGLAGSRGMELLVAGMGSANVGLAIGEKLGLPLLQAYVVPFTPTRDFPSVLLPRPLPKIARPLNRLSHHLTRQIMWQGFRSADRRTRREVLNLPPASFWGPYHAGPTQGLPILYGISSSVIAKPADWSEDIHLTGYWFLEPPDDWRPPEELLAFLESGPPPVYVGFGSMSSRDPEATGRLVLEALAQSGQRAVVMSGWGGLRAADLPESVFAIEAIPHTWLFPRMAAVVHHGGAGTTAAGLRAGVPSIVIPFFGDQPFWGQRVADLGVGPSPLPRKQLSAERLAQAIQTAVSDAAMGQKAAALGEKIRSEDGLGQAAKVVDSIAEQVLAYGRGQTGNSKKLV